MRRSSLKEEPFSESIDIRKKRISMYLEEVANERWEYKIDGKKTIKDVFSAISDKCRDY